MKLEPWVPSFMRRIATIWNEHQAEVSADRSALRADGGRTYVYAVLTSGGIPIEVRSPKPLPYGKLLRTEAKK